jgi:hypothetical protein
MSASNTELREATLLSQILSDANLQLAWRRACQHFTKNYNFVDHAAVASFHRSLERSLREVARDLSTGRYRVAPLRLAPQPKHRLDRTSPLAMREIFWLEPRDQVAWLAIANVVGPLLDNQMPAWSYGHRLSDGNGVRAARHDTRPSDYFVWSPNESWPICQRHIVLTARHMRAGGRIDASQLCPEELIAWQLEMERPIARRLPYWAQEDLQDSCAELRENVFYATFDFKSFSSGLRLNDVKQALYAYLPRLQNEPLLVSLIDSMLEFEVASVPLPSTESLDGIWLKANRLSHLPAGLIVQGFLANVAMLPVDLLASNAMVGLPIAYFRFFDDHIVLSTDASALRDWLCSYRQIVRRLAPSLEFNRKKTKPRHLGNVLAGGEEAILDEQGLSAGVREDVVFDPDEPEKLWPLSALKVHRTEASGNRWTLQLTCSQMEATRRELHRPSPSGGVCWPEPAKRDRDPMQHAIFARIRHMLVELPAKRILLRQAILFLAQTGFPGLGSLLTDLVAQAESVPAVGASQISLFYQLFAPLLPVVALRAISTDCGPEDRAASNAFLLDLVALQAPILTGENEWYLERSKENLMYGLAIARAILASQPTNTSAAPAICLLDRLLERNYAESDHRFRAEAVLAYWNDMQA